MLILNADDVRRCLPMSECIAAMKQAFEALAAGQAVVPLRAQLPVAPHSGTTLVMPAFVDGGDGPDALTVKVVSVFDNNPSRDVARIQAAVLVLEPETARPLAVLEGATLTGIRTAAGSGAATDLMARSGSRVLGVLGAGVQARTHIEAVCCVRSIESVRVFARTPASVEALVAELSGRDGFPEDIRAVASASEAVSEADIVCCTTTSRTPVFDDADIGPGTHINAVGSYQPEVVEVPAATVARSRVVVDDYESAWEEAGDLIQPLTDGEIDRDHVVADMGQLVGGSRDGRTGDQEITLFKSVGLAVEDAMAARVTLANAASLGAGQTVSW